MPADAAKINTLLGGKPIASEDSGKPPDWALPCNLASSNQTLQLQIGGALFDIPLSLLLNGNIDGDQDWCNSWFQGTEREHWVLGTSFLQAVYSVWNYDEKTVGFASVLPLSSSTMQLSPVSTLSVSTPASENAVQTTTVVVVNEVVVGSATAAVTPAVP